MLQWLQVEVCWAHEIILKSKVIVENLQRNNIQQLSRGPSTQHCKLYLSLTLFSHSIHLSWNKKEACILNSCPLRLNYQWLIKQHILAGWHLKSRTYLLYLDIQWVPQGFHQQAYSLIPHRVEVLMDGLTPEHLLPCNLKLHIWVTGPYRGRNETQKCC